MTCSSIANMAVGVGSSLIGIAIMASADSLSSNDMFAMLDCVSDWSAAMLLWSRVASVAILLASSELCCAVVAMLSSAMFNMALGEFNACIAAMLNIMLGLRNCHRHLGIGT